VKTFNSASKLFNSRTAARKNRDPLVKVVFRRGSEITNLENDPEYSYTPRRAISMANEYCSSINDLKQEPSDDAIKLLNLYKDDRGSWRHNAAKSRIANPPTLATYLRLPVISKHFAGDENITHKLNVYDLVANPMLVIGKDKKNREIIPGVYDRTDKQGKTRSYFAHPYLTYNRIKFGRDLAAKNVIDSGSTDAKVWREAMTPIAHLAHGKFDGIMDGIKPLHFQSELEGVLGNIAKNTDIDASRLPRPKLNLAKNYLERFNTVKFAMDFCPNCTLDQWSHGSNSIYDVQDRATAYESQDPLLSGLAHKYFPRNGYVKGSKKVKLDDIGPRAAIAPHNHYMDSDEAMRHLTHIQRLNDDEKHEMFRGLEFDLPTEAPQIDFGRLEHATGRDLILPHWLDEDY
jgi:hypothetical protein